MATDEEIETLAREAAAGDVSAWISWRRATRLDEREESAARVARAVHAFCTAAGRENKVADLVGLTKRFGERAPDVRVDGVGARNRARINDSPNDPWLRGLKDFTRAKVVAAWRTLRRAVSGHARPLVHPRPRLPEHPRPSAYMTRVDGRTAMAHDGEDPAPAWVAAVCAAAGEEAASAIFEAVLPKVKSGQNPVWKFQVAADATVECLHAWHDRSQLPGRGAPACPACSAEERPVRGRMHRSWLPAWHPGHMCDGPNVGCHVDGCNLEQRRSCWTCGRPARHASRVEHSRAVCEVHRTLAGTEIEVEAPPYGAHAPGYMGDLGPPGEEVEVPEEPRAPTNPF